MTESGKRRMLYHYTARENLPGIAAVGLYRGDVPISPTHGICAVWLTSDPDPRGHGLSEARALTRSELRTLGLRRPTRMLDKRAIRLAVEVPDGDERLVSWEVWARENGVTPSWYEVLDRTGGGKASTWFLYHGVVRRSWISAVFDLRKSCAAPDWQELATQACFDEPLPNYESPVAVGVTPSGRMRVLYGEDVLERAKLELVSLPICEIVPVPSEKKLMELVARFAALKEENA